MNYNQKEVALTINLRGAQAIRGSYSHYHKVEKNGKETNGIRLEKAPIFCNAFKTVKFGNEFVQGALSEAPEELHMRPQIWKKMPEERRIAIHVGAYIRAVHPEHRGYTMKIM